MFIWHNCLQFFTIVVHVNLCIHTTVFEYFKLQSVENSKITLDESSAILSLRQVRRPHQSPRHHGAPNQITQSRLSLFDILEGRHFLALHFWKIYPNRSSVIFAPGPPRKSSFKALRRHWNTHRRFVCEYESHITNQMSIYAYVLSLNNIKHFNLFLLLFL